MRVENDLKLIRGTARSELIPIGHASCSPPSSYRLSTSSPPSSPPPRDNLRLCCSRPSTHATATRSWSIDESIEKTIERWEDDANASSANALSHYQSSSRPQTTHIVPSWPADEPLFREIDQTAFWRAKPPQALPFARPGSLSQSDEQPQVTV
ncbi:uncharacterized protein L969DRAFT_87356, partial [Mixia osmundae IAM 14324]|uniref:uncharacterized protein n=1 Tax=Mixia osmundae (strain CBS 9802 / IAM 14324 / JCM 22182 / KY 12970) TaxID=764103 RepID=UPI0004A558CB